MIDGKRRLTMTRTERAFTVMLLERIDCLEIAIKTHRIHTLHAKPAGVETDS